MTEADIQSADVVIIAADIKIGGRDRFEGKRIVEIPTSMVIKAPKRLLETIEEKLNQG